MKKLLLIALILFAGNALASSLPKCSSGHYDNCFGQYVYSGGKTYTGEWREYLYHGKGTLTGDKKTYNGEFLNGKYHGKGSFLYNDGRTYTGEFKNNSRHGQGIYTSTNGDTYEGGWKEGEIHGKGSTTFSDGSIVEGISNNGVYLGTEQELKIEKEKVKKERLERKKERLEKERVEELARIKYETIYTACLLDRSVGIDMQVRELKRAVENTCNKIAENPSWYENFKYNK